MIFDTSMAVFADKAEFDDNGNPVSARSDEIMFMEGTATSLSKRGL